MSNGESQGIIGSPDDAAEELAEAAADLGQAWVCVYVVGTWLTKLSFAYDISGFDDDKKTITEECWKKSMELGTLLDQAKKLMAEYQVLIDQLAE